MKIEAVAGKLSEGELVHALLYTTAFLRIEAQFEFGCAVM